MGKFNVVLRYCLFEKPSCWEYVVWEKIVLGICRWESVGWERLALRNRRLRNCRNTEFAGSYEIDLNLCVCLSACLSWVCLCDYVCLFDFVWLSVSLCCSVCLSVSCFCVGFCVCLSVCLYVWLGSVSLFICPSLYVFLCVCLCGFVSPYMYGVCLLWTGRRVTHTQNPRHTPISQNPRKCSPTILNPPCAMCTGLYEERKHLSKKPSR